MTGVVPESWECLSWKANGGYGNQGQKTQGRENAHRERIWFSPHCLRITLFDQKEIS
jgi:DNA adenine methylase